MDRLDRAIGSNAMNKAIARSSRTMTIWQRRDSPFNDSGHWRNVRSEPCGILNTGNMRSRGATARLTMDHSNSFGNDRVCDSVNVTIPDKRMGAEPKGRGSERPRVCRKQAAEGWAPTFGIACVTGSPDHGRLRPGSHALRISRHLGNFRRVWHRQLLLQGTLRLRPSWPGPPCSFLHKNTARNRLTSFGRPKHSAASPCYLLLPFVFREFADTDAVRLANNQKVL